MSWLDLLLKQTRENEAPERYFWWSGIAAISAVVRKNIWIDRFYYKLYPNVYVALISARSGLKKGIPISVCKRILEEVNLTRLISGCNSIQGIVQELGQQKTLENGTVIGEAHGILLSDEFDAFLTDDPKSLSILTALHNTHEHEKGWEKTLKNSPKASLKAPCLTMLVASNEPLFDSVVKRKDVEGGFIGRTFVVRESKIPRINALVKKPEITLNVPQLATRLVEISKIKGEFKWTDESGEKYEEWYKGVMGEENNDRTGTVNRLGDQVIKVAMLISLARKDDLNLEWQDVELAIDKCEDCAESATRIAPTVESSNGDRPNVMRLVIQSICTSPDFRITKAKMLSALQQHQLYTTDIDRCIGQLISAGWVEKNTSAGDGNVNARTVFALSDEGRRQFNRPEMKRRHVN